jgi:aminoglycoside phosphotransferase (APT) family kinase protein
VGDAKGVDAARVVPWLEEHVDGFAGPAEFTLIAGGHSNLTFGVTDANGVRYVLRRPPLGHVLESAHDMGREHKIIAALGPTPVPVPPALAFCDDAAVNDAPFYVMGFVDGFIIRSAEDAKALTAQQRRAAGESLIDVMADMHAVDVDAVGLGDLGRKEGYIERQLRRWYKQVKGSQELTKRELPDVDVVHDALAAKMPEQGPAAIVHGDYRLDNCMVGRDGKVAAVLDWELCTLGDPLADVGLLMVYWNDPSDTDPALAAASATATDGFPRRAELLERYAARSGRDLSSVDDYVAFGYWKLACLLEGVYARYAAGVMGETTRAQTDGFRANVERLAAAARAAVERIP